MNIRSMTQHWWALALVGTCACSGKTLNDVGDVSGAGASARAGGSASESGGASAGGATGTESGGAYASGGWSATESGGAYASGGWSATESGGASASGTTGINSAGSLSFGGAISGIAGAPPAPPLPVDGPRPVAPASLVGTWRGYVENLKFEDGSDKLELTIVEGKLSGTLVVGDSEPLPPARDPELGYPIGNKPVDSTTSLFVQVNTVPSPGVEYTLIARSLVGDRLQFGIANTELYASWCALQTPYKHRDGSVSCVPDSDGISNTTDGQCFLQEPVTMQLSSRSCAQLALCIQRVCECDAVVCRAARFESTHFDLALNGDRADGSLLLTGKELHNVHLVKVVEE